VWVGAALIFLEVGHEHGYELIAAHPVSFHRETCKHPPAGVNWIESFHGSGFEQCLLFEHFAEAAEIHRFTGAVR